MNKNENKYIKDHEPTQQELDCRVLALAESHREDFYFFLSGWMSNNNLPEMAECARAWLSIHHPDELKE